MHAEEVGPVPGLCGSERPTESRSRNVNPVTMLGSPNSLSVRPNAPRLTSQSPGGRPKAAGLETGNSEEEEKAKELCQDK